MAEKLIRRRAYDVPPAILIGYCQTVLGRMRAEVEQQDLERGTIVATVGGAVLAPVSELALKIATEQSGRTSMVVVWRARRLGGDRAILPAFLESVDALARQA
jgi:hypothetical protein